MICSKCTHSYEQRPRIRYTPTFFHHPIFDDFGLAPPQPVRCTATNHSTVFADQNVSYSKNEPYLQNKSACCCKDQAEPKKQDNEQINERKTQKNWRPQSEEKLPNLKKEISFNPNGSTKFQNAGSHNKLSNHTLLWYDPSKQILLRQSSKCYHHAISKERKLLQMTSCAFYPNGDAQLVQDSTQYGCNDGCGCSQARECLPKFQNKIQPIQTYPNQKSANQKLINQKLVNQKQANPSGCGTEHGCGPNQKCSPSIVVNNNIAQTAQKNQNFKKSSIPNGVKKQKLQQSNIRKSQPVFKSVTAKRR